MEWIINRSEQLVYRQKRRNLGWNIVFQNTLLTCFNQPVQLEVKDLTQHTHTHTHTHTQESLSSIKSCHWKNTGTGDVLTGRMLLRTVAAELLWSWLSSASWSASRFKKHTELVSGECGDQRSWEVAFVLEKEELHICGFNLWLLCVETKFFFLNGSGTTTSCGLLEPMFELSVLGHRRKMAVPHDGHGGKHVAI